MIVNKGNLIHQLEQDVGSNSLGKLSTCKTSFPQVTTDLKTLNEHVRQFKKKFLMNY